MDKTQFALTHQEATSVHAVLILPATHLKDVSILMNVQLSRSLAETMRFVRMPLRDIIAFAHKVIAQSQTQRLLVNKLT